MSKNSSIEWTDHTWNVVTGCTKVSAGCAHCYAERIANRFWGERKFSDVQCHEGRLDEPLKWKKPSKIFVNSMSDLFHERVEDGFIDAAFHRMYKAHWHTFIILTKRPDRMSRYMSRIDKRRDVSNTVEYWQGSKEWRPIPFPLPNVWIGVSVEDQFTADKRIPLLLQTPAAVRFVSYEPALGAVDFRNINGALATWWKNGDIDVVDEGKLDWIIMGGESGPNARPMQIEWASSVVEQCKDAGVPVFVKQLGGYPDKRDKIECFPENLRVREFPANHNSERGL